MLDRFLALARSLSPLGENFFQKNREGRKTFPIPIIYYSFPLSW